MYLHFYGLTKEPFQTTPDEEFLFLTPTHAEAIAAIRYGITQRKGLIAVVGEVGVGKTTILRSYIKSIDDTCRVIYLYNPALSFPALLKVILSELGDVPIGTESADLVSRLHENLIAQYRDGHTVVLIIDEAQHIPAETLEGVRMLSNLETSTDKLIQLVLVGQPELDTMLSRTELRQVRDRIAVWGRIEPLTEKESRDYIEHRLMLAGAQRPIFADKAFRAIIKAGRGNPRRLNIICDHALISGFGQEQPIIAKAPAQQAIADVDGQPFQPLLKRPRVFVPAAVLILLLPLMLHARFSTQAPPSLGGLTTPNADPGNVPVGEDRSERPAQGTRSEPSGEEAPSVTGDIATTSSDEEPLSPAVLVEKTEAAETARLVAVLLDCGRVVVGRAQPAINNPRLEDKGFSSSVFESQLRKEFLARTGYDLRNLAPAPMPDQAKPLLVRLAFFMQKAVQEVQPDINKKGIGFKGFIPATFATKVAEAFSKDTGVKLRQIGPPGVEPRNPSNKPDDQEEQALLAMQKSHPRAGDHVVEQALPNSGVRVLLPLFYTKQCLSCHGKPKGQIDISGYEKEGFKEGDLGGAISVVLSTETGSLKGATRE